MDRKGLKTKISTIIIIAYSVAFNIQAQTNSTTTTSTEKLQLKLNKVEYGIAKEETDPNI